LLYVYMGICYRAYLDKRGNKEIVYISIHSSVYYRTLKIPVLLHPNLP
jgi:hypothetical protein